MCFVKKCLIPELSCQSYPKTRATQLSYPLYLVASIVEFKSENTVHPLSSAKEVEEEAYVGERDGIQEKEA